VEALARIQGDNNGDGHHIGDGREYGSNGTDDEELGDQDSCPAWFGEERTQDGALPVLPGDQEDPKNEHRHGGHRGWLGQHMCHVAAAAEGGRPGLDWDQQVRDCADKGQSNGCRGCDVEGSRLLALPIGASCHPAPPGAATGNAAATAGAPS